MRSNFRTLPPTNHIFYVSFKKEVRQAEVDISKTNPHGNTLVMNKTVLVVYLSIFRIT